MATTKSKKQILDYLWEWAESSGEWAKMLTKLAIEKESSLSEKELNDIYGLYFKEAIAEDKETIPQIPRPEIDLTPSDIALHSLSNIQGVNRLAENQNLHFSKNITVIYGENASGKSGYSRILKSLGFSYEKETEVLCNVYCDDEECQNAKLIFSRNGEHQEFDWDGKCKCTDLQGISVFNNNCVSISLDTERELLVTPIGFHLFHVISDELDNLTALHKTKIASFKKEIDWLSELHEGTKVHNFLNKFNFNSSKDELKTLGSFGEKEKASLKKLKDDKRNLNKKLIQTEITSFKNQLGELKTIKTGIESAKNDFTLQDWNDIGNYLQEIELLKQEEQKGLKEIAEEKGIELYESDEFSSFIRAADDYIKKLNKEDYPSDENEICIYCRQRLSGKEARDLLTSYRLLLNDSTQEQIKDKTQKLNELHFNLKSISSNIKLHYPSFGEDQEKKAIQPEIIKKYCEEVDELKKIANKKVSNKVKKKKFIIDYESIIEELQLKIGTINTKLTEKEETLSNNEEKEEELDGKINELLDRKKLNEKYTDTESILNNLQTAALLEGLTRVFNTDPLSRKSSQARKELIAKNFNPIFDKELSGLRRSEIKVNLKFKTDKAKPLLIQDIGKDYRLTDVLSEGEQKSIALAEFLTELQLDESKTPVVFDDPVTSLDHKIIEEVAKRLIKMSANRQIIIFTHSILLFNSIKQNSELPRFKGIEFRYYETGTDIEYAGYLHDSPTLKEDSFKNYKTKINNILNLPKEERKKKETELAMDGYNKLRPAIEVFVEKEMFQETVKRYRKNVALMRLESVNGALIDEHKETLNDIYERCCGYIEPHSNPDGLPQEPTLAELETDFKEICDIRSAFV